MHMFLHILFYIALVGSVTSTIYCVMVMAAAARFGLRKRREQSAPTDFLPPNSVLKPLHRARHGAQP
jgi:ceramide glucosyltransferase